MTTAPLAQLLKENPKLTYELYKPKVTYTKDKKIARWEAFVEAPTAKEARNYILAPKGKQLMKVHA